MAYDDEDHSKPSRGKHSAGAGHSSRPSGGHDASARTARYFYADFDDADVDQAGGAQDPAATVRASRVAGGYQAGSAYGTSYGSGSAAGYTRRQQPVYDMASHPSATAYDGVSGTASRRQDERATKKRGRRGTGRAIVALVVVLIAIYLVGAGVFSMLFLPRTTINGQNVSLQSKSAVAQQKTSTAKDYTLHVTGDGLDVTLDNRDLNVSFDGNAFVASATQGLNPLAWPIEILTSHDLTADQGLSYDQDALQSSLGSAVDSLNASAAQPQNATITYDSGSKTFQVKPEVAGTALDKDKVVAAVVTALGGSQSTLELGDDMLVQPTVTSDDAGLQSACQTANGYLKATEQLTVDGNNVATVDANRISGWVKLADDLSVSLDTDAITSWTRGDLSKQLDTVGTTRTYTTPYGKQATVTGGTYGWSIDGAALAQTIAQDIQDGQSTTIEIPWAQKGVTYAQGAQDWGSRYIDVDLSEQHVRMYDDSGALIWESDCVSGNTSEGHDTPQGVYSINNNMRTGNVQLRGTDENGDGQPDYISYVTYWMPFVDNLVAFHDASWRASFGGTIYQTDGSHGCVNLPKDKAQELYGLVQVGDVVVVHA